jgi:capsular polysaccharide biosynthesis protein
MELRELWAVVVRRWWLIALPALVAAVLVLPMLGNVISPPVTYNAAVRFTVSQPPGGSGATGSAPSAGTFEDDSYIPWLTSEYAVVNLAGWMRTESFAREVAAVLAAQGLDLDPAAIQGAINADAVRSIMTLYLSWPDAAQLERIAQAATQVLQERHQAYWPQLAAARAVVTALDTPRAAPGPASLADRLSPLFRILIGLVAGLGLAFLAEYLDTGIRTRQEAESTLTLPVLAEIPPHR